MLNKTQQVYEVTYYRNILTRKMFRILGNKDVLTNKPVNWFDRLLSRKISKGLILDMGEFKFGNDVPVSIIINLNINYMNKTLTIDYIIPKPEGDNTPLSCLDEVQAKRLRLTNTYKFFTQNNIEVYI